MCGIICDIYSQSQLNWRDRDWPELPGTADAGIWSRPVAVDRSCVYHPKRAHFSNVNEYSTLARFLWFYTL